MAGFEISLSKSHPSQNDPDADGEMAKVPKHTNANKKDEQKVGIKSGFLRRYIKQKMKTTNPSVCAPDGPISTAMVFLPITPAH